VGDEKQCQAVLGHALALGADEAILINSSCIKNDNLDKASEATHGSEIASMLKRINSQNQNTYSFPPPRIIAYLLSRLITMDSGDPTIDLVIMGKQAIDGDSGQTGPALGAFLNWACLGNASKVTLMRQQAQKVNHAHASTGTGDALILVTSDMETGSETNETHLPCIVTVDLCLNEPRNASLPSIMEAKQKKIRTISMGELFMDAKTGGRTVDQRGMQVLRCELGLTRTVETIPVKENKKQCEIVKSVEELADRICSVLKD
jgi:electron transfer flavoprotein alpha/beta subunit